MSNAGQYYHKNRKEKIGYKWEKYKKETINIEYHSASQRTRKWEENIYQKETKFEKIWKIPEKNLKLE